MERRGIEKQTTTRNAPKKPSPLLLAALALAIAASLCPAAHASDDYDDAPPGLEQEYTFKLTHEITSNLYGASVNEEKASRLAASLDGNFTWTKNAGTRFTGAIAVAQHDYIDITGEDYKDAALKIGCEKDLSETLTGAIEISSDEIDATNSSAISLDSRETKSLLRLTAQIGETHTLEIQTWRGKQKYTRYTELENGSGGISANITRDLGGFSTADLTYKREKKKHPNETIISSAGDETQTTRTDQTSTLSVSITKIISLAPLSFLQAGIEQENNTSDNAEYYLWFDPASLEFPTKVVRGYDTYKKRTAYIYGSHGITANDILSAYYMLDKTKYPGRLLGNYGNAEPFEATANTLEYISLTLKHALGEKQALEAASAWTHSRSNDSAYTYNERVISLGVTFDF